MTDEPFVPVHTSADSDLRITLPNEVSSRITWLAGTDEVHCWLLLLALGRYRLLSDEQAQDDPQLEPVRLLVLEGKPATSAGPMHASSSTSATIVARLIPIRIDYYKKRRRICFPKELSVFAPNDCDARAFSLVFSLEGYWELWYTGVLRATVLSPEHK